jgi:hypothetical protein
MSGHVALTSLVGMVHSSTNVFNLWFLDSGRYSQQAGIGGYDWVRPSQTAWYSEASEVLRATNGGRVANALAFFHIPFLEYELVSGKVGDTQEGVFDADLNSGLYTAFVEAGDVRATFVGHDHGMVTQRVVRAHRDMHSHAIPPALSLPFSLSLSLVSSARTWGR